MLTGQGTSLSHPRGDRAAPQPPHPFPQGIHPPSATTCPAHPWRRQQRGCSSASKPTHPNFLCNPPHSHMHHPPGLHFWRRAWAAAVSYFSVVDDLNSSPHYGDGSNVHRVSPGLNCNSSLFYLLEFNWILSNSPDTPFSL